MTTKLIGGILLVTGTAIGAGLLALPIATAANGFIPATLLLLLCWAAMTGSAFLLLEITLWLPRNTNLISMAKKTLGPFGQLAAWVLYLLLLYALLAAYISGGAGILKNIAGMSHIKLSDHFASILFTISFSAIVWFGIKAVDFVNRGLMSAKLIVFVLLILLIMPAISLEQLNHSHWPKIGNGMTVVITSFGFAVIIPSLRNYFQDNLIQLRLAILWGSLIPLICYLSWNAVVMGVIPTKGTYGLFAILHATQPTDFFIHSLSVLLKQNFIIQMTRIFTSICMLTSFLGVALCLVDFLKDGIDIQHTTKTHAGIFLLALCPPLAIVLFRPGIFISALHYAGIIVVTLLIILPVLMVWRGRYQLHLSTPKHYRVMGGKFFLLFLLIFSAIAIGY